MGRESPLTVEDQIRRALPALPEASADELVQVVVPSAGESAHRLAQAAYHALPVHSLPIDILVTAKDEFERRSRAGSRRAHGH